jgi:hypothetical protein
VLGAAFCCCSNGGEVEVLACFTVDDGFDLLPGDPDADCPGLHSGRPRCFPKIPELGVSLEASEVDLKPVRVGVRDHDYLPGYAETPAGCMAGASEA